MTLFEKMTLFPEDPILGLTQTFQKDPRKQKVNLGVGTYKDSEGNPYVLEVVKKAEKILSNGQLDKEYGPIEGPPVYREETLKLVFGPQNPRLKEICCIQTLGATGALRVGATLLKVEGERVAHVAEPNWPNHRGVFEQAGFHVEAYPYYDAANQTIDFPAIMAYLDKLPEGSLFVVQGACHNPTGCDPTLDQWQQMSQLMLQRGIIPFFDVAYIGFGQSFEKDIAPVRLFAADGHQMLVAYSYSKNMGLYGERAGALLVVSNGEERNQIVLSHLKRLVRTQYSVAPLYPARLVSIVLTDQALKRGWMEELENMHMRIQEMRTWLASGLMTKYNGKDLSFIERQKGLFSFIGLTREQTLRLRDEFAIHMLLSGRINVAGLTPYNIEYVIESIHRVLP